MMPNQDCYFHDNGAYVILKRYHQIKKISEEPLIISAVAHSDFVPPLYNKDMQSLII